MATSHDEPKADSKGDTEPKVHEIAGGWITERAGTPIPVFLKIAYVGFCLFGLFYLFNYRFGEVGHATRGPLVQQLNQVADQPPAAWFVFLAVVLLAFIVGLLAFAFRSREEE